MTPGADAVARVARSLREEARATNERRLLVCHGSRDACYAAAERALDAAGVEPPECALVGRRDALDCERISPKRADRLLGTTLDGAVLDCHDECRPNAIGRTVGAVDGGGLLLVLAPPLDEWPDRPDGFDEALAVPPYATDAVGSRFRERLRTTLRQHPGVAVVDADAGTIERDGLTHPAPRRPRPAPRVPAEHAFPAAAYEACLSADQAEALAAFERLRSPNSALVVEADRGRGKSAVAGLAAACLAREGVDVLVTAPAYRSAAELFARAAALLDALAVPADVDDPGEPRDVRLDGGRVRFADPGEAASLAADADAVFVDEAAALSVRRLDALLVADRLAFTTTVHGYEGSGRGFDVRFRDHLAATDLAVTDCRLDDPIRYAPADPVELWAFRALCLDARPPVAPLVEDATPETVRYAELDPDALVADETLLGEAFGLLVDAHYRTEPNDLARLLDAPNLHARALVHDGHPVAVALLAEEGNLDADLRARMYEGERVRGNMLPDVLTSQLRDEEAAALSGIRVVRVATHADARSRGLGSALLDAVAEEFGPDRDWLGVGYGATPELLRFWADNGYSTFHLSTTRNDASGEYSALMLRPTSEAGRALAARHAAWFAERAPAVLASSLRDADPAVVRLALRAADANLSLSLSDRDWRLVAGAAYGPALSAIDPTPFVALARKHLVDPADPDLLTARQERLLVAGVLQGRPWDDVADELGFHSASACLRALGEAYQPLVDVYGNQMAREERDRY